MSGSHKVAGELIVKSDERGEVLSGHFTRKSSAKGAVASKGNNPFSERIRERCRAGTWALIPPKSEAEVLLAVCDLPTNRVTGPDETPVEFFRNSPAPLGNLPSLCF